MSYGESVPVADNATAAGRAKNRRIEILVYRNAIGVAAAGRSAPAR
jgi:flagellar motor protein MotB